MKIEVRKRIALMMAAIVGLPSVGITVQASTTSVIGVPKPIYSWEFEKEDLRYNAEMEFTTPPAYEIEQTTPGAYTIEGAEQFSRNIVNSVNAMNPAGDAKLNKGASIVEDEERGSVLYLPGGSADAGWLSLPQDIYKEVTNAMTFAMWVKIDEGAGAYSRLLSSTLTEKGLTQQGQSGWWNDPEFGMVVGGGDYNHRIFKGSGANADYKVDVRWHNPINKDTWQHVVVAMNKSGTYKVYLDGEELPDASICGSNSTQDASVESAMDVLFDKAFLDCLKYNDFGRSLYNSDANVGGKFDDIQIYNQTLTKNEVSRLYQSYQENPYEKLVSIDYSFENVEGEIVYNEIENGANATLGSQATIVYDEEKESHVLNLPGGSAQGGSWLTLPEYLFGGVNGAEGFAISMDVKLPSANDSYYTRLFAASPYELGYDYDGYEEWGWRDPEFALVRGGREYNLRMFSGISESGIAQGGLDVKYETQFKEDTWQNIIITMKQDDFAVYFDGKKVADLDSATVKRFEEHAIEDALEIFFQDHYIEQLKYSALGRSLYTSDSNFTGRIDNFRFYTKHLTEQEVAEIVGKGDTSALENALSEAKKIEGTSYTEASYGYLEKIMRQIEEALGGSILSQGQIDELLVLLEGAINGLRYPLKEEIMPDYYYSFDSGVTNNEILNDINLASESDKAKLEAKASIKPDRDRGQILRLPGGANGKGGSLTLPEGLFEGVTGGEGFTYTAWIKLDQDVHQWSRILDIGAESFGTGKRPYIFFSAQNGMSIDTTIDNALRGFSVEKGEWIHVAYTVDQEIQIIYINGMPMDSKFTNKDLFDIIPSFTKNSIGQSRYSADPDLKGSIDDVMFFKRTLSPNEIKDLIGIEYDATLKSISVKGEKIIMEPGKLTYNYPVLNASQVEEPYDIELNHPDATYELERTKTYRYSIKVTSPNGKAHTTYFVDFMDKNKGAVASFDMRQTNGAIMHGSTGFLYGASEPNIPTIDLLQPLKPKVMVQKAPNGLQHPSGDGTRVADYILEAGTEEIQIYIQDTYYQWPYEYRGIDQYETIARDVVNTIKNDKNKDQYVYVLFNEPDQIWFGGNMGENGFCKAWKQIYDAVKEEDSEAKVAGPNIADYNRWEMETFIKFAIENDCMPDVITWHELYQSDGDFMVSWDGHLEHYRSLEEQYGFTRKVVVNEYAKFHDNGTPGQLIQWISRFENSKVYACLPFWYLANSLNELVADANKPNGAWWLYKWYADMTGDTVPVETYNVNEDGMYGLVALDEDKETTYVLFGGQEGRLTTSMEYLVDTESFENVDSVHVKLYRTKFTGFYGSQYTPYVEFDGDVDLIEGSLDIAVEDADAFDAFFAIVTPATGETSEYEKTWMSVYEAEDATLVECDAYRSTDERSVSNGLYVKNISSSESKVKFNVNVPKDGKYKLEIYYGNAAPLTNGQNRAQGKPAKQLLKVDGREHSILTYHSTIKENYFGSETVYVDLTEGSHVIEFSKNSGTDATLDKMHLIYSGTMGRHPTYEYTYEIEEADYDDNFKLQNTKLGFSSAGYLEGAGEIVIPVIVEKNGYYGIQIDYLSNQKTDMNLYKQIINHPVDGMNSTSFTTEWDKIASYTLRETDAINTSESVKVYLTSGVNTLKFEVKDNIALDALRLQYDKELTDEEVICIEAENAMLFGSAQIVDKKDVSGDKIVGNIGLSKDNGITIPIEVEQAGSYKLSIDYINNEPAPPIVTEEHPDGYVHPYNTDLVERYAQIIVNEQLPRTVYFLNTLSWDMTKNIVVDIELDEGENTIILYNDNSYKFSNVDQYAPDFDRFEIAKATLQAGEEQEKPTEPEAPEYTKNDKDEVKKSRKVVEININKDTEDQFIEGNKAYVEVEENIDELIVRIDVEKLLQLQEGIDIYSSLGMYSLLPENVNWEKLEKQLSEAYSTLESKIEIKMSSKELVELTGVKGEILGGPVSFEVNYINGNDVTSINLFNRLVESGIRIDDDEDRQKVITAVRVDNENNISVVPIEIKEINGRTYANFKTLTSGNYVLMSHTVTFEDMKGHWAEDMTNELASHFIIKGMGENKFRPELRSTRAEVAKIIIAMLGLQEDEGGVAFSDVEEGMWYTGSIKTACKYGMIVGYEDGTFKPINNITRQEVITMISNVLEFIGYDCQIRDEELQMILEQFKDAGEIAKWAREDMALCIKLGIIQGDEQGLLNPTDFINRGEMSAIIFKTLTVMDLI